MSIKSDTLLDKRVVQRNINRNLLSRKEYEQHLKSLPDVTDKSVPMFFEEESDASAEDSGD